MRHTMRPLVTGVQSGALPLSAVAAVDHVAARAAVQNVASVAAVQGVIAIVAPEVADRPRTRRIIEVVVVRPAIGRLRGFLVLRAVRLEAAGQGEDVAATAERISSEVRRVGKEEVRTCKARWV